MIEKILERLETKCFEAAHDESDATDTFVEHYYAGKRIAFVNAIDIMQEVAKEGGWIPCEVEMPKEHKNVLLTVLHFSEAQKGYWADGVWWEADTDVKFLPGAVIAWQQLPAPYQKGE